jgi:hypothetical protein
MEALESVAVTPGKGLDGDRFKGRETSKRQVTLMKGVILALEAAFRPVYADCANRKFSVKPEQKANNSKKKHSNMDSQVLRGRGGGLAGETKVILAKQPHAASLAVVS